MRTHGNSSFNAEELANCFQSAWQSFKSLTPPYSYGCVLSTLSDNHLSGCLCRFDCVLVGVSVAVIRHHYQSKLGMKGFVLLTLPSNCLSFKELKQSRNMGGRS